MSIIFTDIDQAEIAREVVIKVLESSVKELGTDKGFAKETQLITPVFLSYIKHGKRMISLDKARSIAPFLPLSYEDQESWLHHVAIYWGSKKNHYRFVKEQGPQELANILNEVSTIYRSATHNSDPNVVKQNYHQAMNIAETTLDALNIQRQPIIYLELCTMLQDLYSIMGRVVDALAFAKLSKYVCHLIDASDYPQHFERLNFHNVNVFRTEIVALHNLKRDEEAFALTQEVEQVDTFKDDSIFWKPHLYRDRLNAMSGMKRVSISDAFYLAEAAKDICQKRADSHDPLLSFLIDRSLARVLIARGNKLNLKRGNQLLRKNYDELNMIPHLGVLHKVLFLRTYAEAWWIQGDNVQGAEIMRQAIEIATEANLLHQLTEMNKHYNEE